MNALLALGLICTLAVFCFWVAERYRLPAILLLLAGGALLGWAVGHDVSHHYLDRLLPGLLGSSLALLFFDGGRKLASLPLGEDRSLVMHLVGWGAKLGWVSMTLLARFLLGLPATEAALCGGVLMLSAPYVIDDLSERLEGGARISLILHWEAFLLSCLGAVWTVLMFGAVEVQSGEPSIPVLIWTTLLNAVVGLLAGLVGTAVLRLARRDMPRDLREPLAVALTFLCFGLSQSVYWGSGLMAAITFGYLAKEDRLPEQAHSFWQSLRVLMVGMLGVCMGVLLPWPTLFENWPTRLLFALLVVGVVRPLLVAVGARHGVSRREKLILSLSWPRGVMMLAAATLIAQRLEHLGYQNAPRLIPIAYWVLVVSVLVPWGLGPWLLPKETSAQKALDGLEKS